MSAPLVLLTRGSDLAMWQARTVRGLLARVDVAVEIRVVESHGDRDRTTALERTAGDGFFTKALQRALLAGEGDLAVHSLKDLPSAPVEGLSLAAFPQRGPCEDVLLRKGGGGLEALPEGAVVGTSSPRRRAWLRDRRPDLRFVELRGNVPTRRAKVLDGELDATVLARAGLDRLGFMDVHTHVLHPSWMVPAACQGILGVETRAGDVAEGRVARIDDPEVRKVALAERAFLRTMGAGCQTPVGVLARLEGADVTLAARWSLEEEGPPLQALQRGRDPVDAGTRLGEAMLGLRAEREGSAG